jgi:hypothetical protein
MGFKEVTLDNKKVVNAMRKKGKIKGKIKIFECDNTKIIYSYDANTKHASVSNPYRKVRLIEIDYALEITELKYGVFKLFETETGVVHINSIENLALQK